MSEEESDLPKRSWLEKISHSFLGEPQNEQDVIDLLKDAHERDVLDSEALEMIQGVLNVAKRQVRDIMIPRSQMVVVDQNQPPEVFLPMIVESAHSRFPVMGEDKDDIVGILLAKDLLKHQIEHPGQPLKLTPELIRPTVFVPESKHLNALLREFRSSRNHLAIVVDEYGNVSGVVTIEDVLEEIVGEIEDEYDVAEEDPIQHIEADRYTVSALTKIEEFNEYFNAQFSDDHVDTMGGLVMQALERVPKSGEKIVLENMQFTVLKANRRSIELLELHTGAAE